jgi:hypothetical protein
MVPERGSHTSVVMTSDDKSLKEDALEAENAGLRELLSHDSAYRKLKGSRSQCPLLGPISDICGVAVSNAHAMLA